MKTKTDPFAKVPHAISPVTGEHEIVRPHVAGATWAWFVMIVMNGHTNGSATARLAKLGGFDF